MTSDVQVQYVTGENPHFKITSPKYKTTFFVRQDPSDERSRYTITTSEGAKSPTLGGHYLNPLLAISTLTDFLRTAKESRSAKKDNLKHGATASQDGPGSPQ